MKQDQNLRAIIASHEAELTDMERDIAQYFLSSEARQHSLSSSRVTELLHKAPSPENLPGNYPTTCHRVHGAYGE